MSITWGQPAALWLLLCVLLLLLIKPKRPHQRISVGTLHLWTSLQASHTPSFARRFRRPPLFVLQASLIATLVVALAEPRIQLTSSDLAIILDTSMSMGARDGGRTRLEQAKERVDSLVRDLPRGGRARVYLAGAQVRLLGEVTSAGRELGSLLATVRASDTTADITSAIAKARSDSPSSAFYVITDVRELPLADDVTWIPVGTPAGNMALTALETAHAPGTPYVSVLVSAANHDSTDIDAEISILRDDAVLASRTVHIRANGQASTTFELTQASGAISAKLNVDDALAADNLRFAVLDAPRRLAVQIRGSSPLIEHALAVHPRVARVSASVAPTPDIIVCVGCSDIPNDLPRAAVLMVPSADDKPAADAPLVITDGGHRLATALVAGVPVAPISGNSSVNERAIVARAGSQPVIAAYPLGERRIVDLRFDLTTLAGHGDAMFPLLVANIVEWLVPPDKSPAIATQADPTVTADRAGVYRMNDAEGPRLYVVNPPVDDESDLSNSAPEPVFAVGAIAASRTSTTTVRSVWLLAALALLAFEWRQQAQARRR